MVSLPDSARDPRVLAVLGGLAYAAVVFAWLSSEGLRFASHDPVTTAFGFGYSLGGRGGVVQIDRSRERHCRGDIARLRTLPGSGGAEVIPPVRDLS